MNSRVKTMSLGFLAASFAFTTQIASAQTVVGPVTIKGITTGWGGDFFGVSTGTTAANPANCPTADTYSSSSVESGYRTYLAAALTALSNGQSVTIVVDNVSCSNNRPKLIGLNISA
ncbi:hypothetical protein [Dyella jiangningensis]|uniref:hypothetical protein n=1 Tax=Dyella jiangningensis TaxID=1379159 RepID=UPI0011BDBAEF|nr:hypothetical protein [Dyella jiangningensis]